MLGGDEEVVESTTTCEYDPEETVWSDAPVVVTETVWSDAPAPSKPVQGGKGDPEHVWSDAGDKWTTTTATGTVTGMSKALRPPYSKPGC